MHHATHADANGMAGVGRGEAEEVEMGHDGEVVAVSQGNRAHADEGHGTDAQHEANHEDPQHEAQHQGSQHEGPQPEQSHGVVSFHEGRPPVPQEHSFAYMINGQHDGQREETASPGGACDGQGGADVVGGTDHVVSAEMHVATLASLAEQVDIRYGWCVWCLLCGWCFLCGWCVVFALCVFFLSVFLHVVCVGCC